MAISIGRVEEEVVFSGHGNVAEARAIGEEAGAASGDGYDKAWTDKLENIGKKTKTKFGQTGKDAGDEFNKNLTPALDDKAVKKLSSSLDNLSGALKRNRVQVENHGQSLRRWQAITLAVTALILGAGNDIAVLGSALGAGTAVFGSAILSLGIAGLVAASIFKDLNTKIAKLPASMQDVAKQFDDLKQSFKDLRDNLSITFVKNIGSGFGDLSRIVKGITPNLDDVAVALADVFKATVAGLAPGTKGFENLQKVIENSADTFRKVAKVAGTFGSALLQMFGSSRLQESVTKLIGWLGDLATAFQGFVSGNGFNKWLDNADKVFGHIGQLLDSLGKTLNHLATDAAVNSLDALLSSVSNLLPVLGGLIDVGGKLDPLGLIASLLDKIGAAVTPLIKPLEDLFTQFNRILGLAIDQWGKDLAGALDGVGPIIEDVANALKKLDAKTIQGIADAVFAAAAAFAAFKLVSLGGGFAGKINTLAGSMDKLSTKAIALKASSGGVAGAVGGIVTALSGGGPGGSALAGGLTGAQVGGLPGFLIGALAGAIASLFTDWPKWKNGLDEISNFFTKWWKNITSGGALANGWDQLVSKFGNGLGQIGNAFKTFFGNLPESLGHGWSQITDAFGNGWAQLMDKFGNGWAQIGAAFANGWDQIVAAFANGWNQIVAFFQSIFITTATWVANIVGQFIAWGVGVGVAIATWIGQVITNWNNFWTTLYVNATAWIGTIIFNVVQFGIGIVTNILSFVGTVIAGWNGFWTDLWATLVNWTNSIINSVIVWGATLVANVENFIGGLLNWWNGIWAGFGSAVNDAWNGIVSVVEGAVNSVIGSVNSLLGPLNNVINLFNKITGLHAPNIHIPSITQDAPGGGGGSLVSRVTASGGVFAGAQARIIAEAGAEAVVPLQRDLSRVDPSVRALSAIAQGKGGSGTATPGKQITVEAGAVQVTYTGVDPEVVGTSAIDRLIARFA